MNFSDRGSYLFFSQEVAVQEFSEFFKTELARADYAGVFKPKSR